MGAMTDRLDEVLEDLARVDAPAGFAARVRARLEPTTVPASTWPRLAAAACAALLVAGGWLITSRSGGGTLAPQSDEHGRAEALPPQLSASRRAEALPPQLSESRRAEALPPQLSASRRAEALPPRPRTSDHEHALPALAQPAPVALPSLLTEAVFVDVRDLAPLGAIAPIEIPALGADQGETR
jgi:hypothetical protein